MPLDIPARRDVSRSLQTYVRSDLPELDPTPERRSKIGAWVKSVASAVHDWYVALKDYADRQPFPQTATGKFLTQGWWRDITKLDPLPAAGSIGYVAFQGTAGTAIPSGTTLQVNGVEFKTQSAATIAAQIIVPNTLIYDGALAIAVFVTNEPHMLATGMQVVIAGATPAEFNGTFTVSVTDDDEFTYQPPVAPGSTPAGGSPTASATWAAGLIAATTVGAATNSSGGEITVTDTISGLNPQALAAYGGIAGGTEAETDEAYRDRILKALGTDFGAFTADEIDIVARSVPGVTRVWVKKATLGGANGVFEGQVKVAFVRDGEVNIFPTTAEIDTVKSKILVNCMTANTAPEDVMVLAPTPHVVDVTVAITPDSTAMRAAVKSALSQWFTESADYESDVLRLDLQCVLKGLVDPVTRAKLSSFSMTVPASDVTIGDNELPKLGAVSFV